LLHQLTVQFKTLRSPFDLICRKEQVVIQTGEGHGPMKSWSNPMQALRAAIAMALGLSLIVLSLALLAPSPAPIVHALAQVAGGRAGRMAEVAVAFDKQGRPTSHALRRSSGSQRSDAAAVSEALELASLSEPCAVAGRTVLFTARFDQASQLD
jgi:hypothetical protein